ncbi:MAG TPA: glycine betaine ABC transporter substrate-binding protein [Polyangia bacterium]|jgi:osmoprotectant transport system permease protein|nr:glycine betaine ABC transporter substrate-binding protein [Polyangia bacterium]
MTGPARAAALALVLAASACRPERDLGRSVVVASKSFTESVILGEMVQILVTETGLPVEHKGQLGGTEVVFRALETGAVDVYPEYTGTLTKEILSKEIAGRPLADVLAAHGLRMTKSLGFDNSYALAMTEARAAALGIRRISDLTAHRDLRFVFSNEVMSRGDGWPGLRAHYALPQEARGMDHDLAYRALASGAADVIDVYTTDAEIRAYGLRVLEDDRRFFTRYDAILLYRADLEARAPAAVAACKHLEGRIDNATMVALNARVKLDRASEVAAASEFLHPGGAPRARERFLSSIAARAVEHTTLVLLSLLAAIALAVPLGIVAARRPRLGRLVVGAAGLLQTIPSLALLVLLIPLVGIGSPPVIAALFLYGLLPIVRNTHAGLVGIPEPLEVSARALGLPARARLRLVELPLALPFIVAGIKTSAVIAVGTATVGALVGAGGFGQPILTGIRLNDFGLILQGAVPAAVMAIALEALLGAVERRVVPRGLRPPG